MWFIKVSQLILFTDLKKKKKETHSLCIFLQYLLLLNLSLFYGAKEVYENTFPAVQKGYDVIWDAKLDFEKARGSTCVCDSTIGEQHTESKGLDVSIVFQKISLNFHTSIKSIAVWSEISVLIWL